ncbi:MAG TPA: phospho-N-acetylmuramoyl-pentapeptide-transferase [Candidatus Bathyarchaeia archaeon]|nr:phospho-N-acetylmuramoyl-pentapeptide-transferase [Candidatus Bathyarchaeia archaeon]
MQLADITTIPSAMAALKIWIIGTVAFLLAMTWTPLLSKFLYKYKIGIKIKEDSVDGEKAPVYHGLHKDKSGTPTMGGALVWITVLFLAILFHLIRPLFESKVIVRLDFLSRSQTWLPLFALITTAIVGAFDDIFSVKGWGSNKGGGMRFLYRFGWLFLIAIAGSLWFFFKLKHGEIHVPGFGDFNIGFWYIPFFIFVVLATAFSSNETDGLDGLNGGILLIAFAVFGTMAFAQSKIDLAAFCSAICGSLLAFLWFNIYPARFFMGDTGSASLGATLAVVAILTNASLILPIVCIVYIIESLSVAAQLISKKYFGRKIFLSTPIHHHFEAVGWPETKFTMRAWILTGVAAGMGLVIGILGMGK